MGTPTKDCSLIKILLSIIRVYLKRVCFKCQSVSYPTYWVLFMGWLGKWLTTLRILIYPFVYFYFYTNLYPKCYPYPISFFIRTFDLLRLGIWAILSIVVDSAMYLWFCHPFWYNIIGEDYLVLSLAYSS